MSQLTPGRLRFMEENKYKHKKKQRNIRNKGTLLSPIYERESKEKSDYDYLENTKQNLTKRFDESYVPSKKPKRTKKKKSRGCVGSMCSSKKSKS